MSTQQVAIAVIINDKNQVLISKRSTKQHQGEKWEFPGGKVEATETSEEALQRELKEELGISIHSASPLVNITHQYETLTVHLNVFKVKQWSGEVEAMEGQPLRWVEISALNHYEFPSANAEILNILTTRS